MGLIKTTLTLGAGYAIAHKALNTLNKHDEAKARQMEYSRQESQGYGPRFQDGDYQQSQPQGYGSGSGSGSYGYGSLAGGAREVIEGVLGGEAPPVYGSGAEAGKKEEKMMRFGQHAAWCNGTCGGRCSA